MGSVRKTETGSVLNFNTYLPKNLDETKISFTPKQSGSGTPSPENVREIVGKNGITVWQSNKGVFHNLPSAYQEVEYIEGTGTQKIDTRIVFNDSDFNVSCRFVLPEYYGNTEYPIISIWKATYNYWNCFLRGSYNKRMDVYTGAHNQTTTITNEGEINDISVSRTDTQWTLTHNGESVNWEYTPTITNDTTLKVFTRGDSNAASRIRVYSLTVEIEGELVGDFVPCYRKSDSVAGLYDLVTKTFFTNYADDTNFVVSEDIVGVETSVSFDDVPQDIDSSEVAGTIYGGYVDISKGVLVAEWAEIASYSGETLTDEWLSDRDVYSASGTPTTGAQVVYKLAEPIHYPLSPRILTTLRGNNVMWSDGDELTISYTDDVVNTYDFRRHISLDTPHKASASGAVASFGTDMVGKMKCKIHFTPKQEGSGTPSPDNVRNIVGRNSVKLWQSGKNLFNKASAKMGRYESVDGVWTLVENAVWYASDLIRVKPNTRYSMFGGTPLASVGAYINVYDEDMTRVNYTTHLSYIDTTANAKYLSVHSTGTGSFYKNRDTIMICEGSDVPSEYEPYTGNEITFTFPSTVGDSGVVYGGYVDLVNGEVVAEWYKVPTSAFVKYRQNNGYIAYRYEAPDYASGIPWLCNLIGEYGSFSTSNMTKNIIQSSRVGGKIYLALDETVDINTLQIVFPLEEPIHYPIPSRILTTLRGSNRLWSDGDPVEVEYYKHTDEPQEYIPAEVLGTGNIAIVTSDGYLIGEEQDYIKY